MSLGVLTIQGMRAAGQAPTLSNGFQGLNGLSGESDQALRNSVVDVVVDIGDAGRVFFYDSRLAQALRDRLNNSGFKVISLDASNLGSFGGGGTIRARVQILTDGYASAADAASVVAGAAAYLGYNATGSSGIIVQSGSGQQSGNGSGQSGSGQTYEKPNDLGEKSPVETLWSSLTESPISLAVVVGGAAILLLVALKK